MKNAGLVHQPSIDRLRQAMNQSAAVKTKSFDVAMAESQERRKQYLAKKQSLKPDVSNAESRLVQIQNAVQSLGPQLWKDLHTTVTAEMLADWEKQIPSYGCPCRDSYKQLKRECRPEQYDDFFAWTVAIHNLVNAKLKEQTGDCTYEQTSLEQARSLWRNEFPRRNSRAVVTVSTGKQYRQLLEVTGPTHASYAQRVQADYIQLTNQLYNDWKQEKFRAGVVGQHYDQTLFVDCDVIIRSSCPDVFDVGGVYIHDDREKLRMTHWCEGDIKRVAESQGVEPWPYLRCLNTGFFTFARNYNPWVMPTQPFPDSHCAEQWWVDRHIKQWQRMDSVNNWQWWFHDFWDGVDSANVVHLANCPKDIRVQLAKQFIAGKTSSELRNQYFEKWKTSASL